jgi:hypothetical protein
MKRSTKSGKAPAATPQPQQISRTICRTDHVDFRRQNLVNSSGMVEDAPTTTYLLLAQRFEDGKDLEWIQDVELSCDEYDKLRRYLAQLRGLMPAKRSA